MIQINITKEQFARVQQYLNDERFKQLIQEALMAAGFTLEGEIVKNIAERASNNGYLGQSWNTKEAGDLKVKVFTNLEYAAFVEFGTRPHRMPIEPLKAWVKKKFGIAEPREINNTSWKVWHKIARKGTPEKRYFRDAIDKFTKGDTYEVSLDKIIDNLIKEWTNVQ